MRNHRFFDSKGPGGVPTPRPASAPGPRSHEGRDLEIDKEHIIQYAHYGYTYCMILAGGLNEESFTDEVLISGGGDGAVKIWSLDKATGGAISEVKCLENGDESVLALALDGTLLYSGRLEGDINVWDLETYQMIRRVEAHPEDILTIAVGHGSIFSGNAGGTIKVSYGQGFEFLANT